MSPLVAVLREALAHAMPRGAAASAAVREAERRAKARRCRTCTASWRTAPTDPARLPPERLIVFDEAQRAWDEAKAQARHAEQARRRLTMSEPAHTLEIMGRRPAGPWWWR